MAGEWWLAGTVDPSNCIAAYQAIDAASEAESLVNLANPGVHDLTERGSQASWSAEGGWACTGSDGYLACGTALFPASNWTILHRVANAQNTSMQFMGACAYPNRDAGISLNNVTTYQEHHNFGECAVGGVVVSSVMGIVGKDFYLDGADAGNFAAGSGTCGYEFYVGCENWAGTAHGGGNHDMLALAFYNTTLTAAQVAAISTAMAALGAAAPTLAAEVAGSATVAAALQVSKPLAAVAAGSADCAVVNLAVTRAIAAAMAGAGTLAATLTASEQINPAATLTGVGSLAASLSVDRILAGSVTGEGSLMASLVATRQLAAVAAGLGSVACLLTSGVEMADPGLAMSPTAMMRSLR